jgi:predicted alpha/beta superfamily hydrolase
MRYLVVLFFFAMQIPAMGQHTMRVRVDQVPSNHPAEPIYLTGNFNQWQPADTAYQLKEISKGLWEIVIELKDVPSDRVEFKLTRGDWQRSECSEKGHLETPRIAALGKDLDITCQIAGWRDFFPASTASPQVHVVDSAFYMPQLDRHRTICIYLPKDYEHTDQRYPVLYLQDGQHVFDEKTSKGRIGPIEWGVDEVIDQSSTPSIVVAIYHQDSYDERYPEYFLHANPEYSKVDGEAYLAFIVETLKPYIDTHYRTFTEAKQTGIAGSSMGGLLSFYAGLRYPAIFGKVGVFSPSIWLDHGHIQEEIARLNQTSLYHDQYYYFYAGKEENRRKPDGTFVQMAQDVEQTARLLKEKVNPRIEQTIHPRGRHGALHWREAFPAFYEWFIRQTSSTQ